MPRLWLSRVAGGTTDHDEDRRTQPGCRRWRGPEAWAGASHRGPVACNARCMLRASPWRRWGPWRGRGHEQGAGKPARLRGIRSPQDRGPSPAPPRGDGATPWKSFASNVANRSNDVAAGVWRQHQAREVESTGLRGTGEALRGGMRHCGHRSSRQAHLMTAGAWQSEDSVLLSPTDLAVSAERKRRVRHYRNLAIRRPATSRRRHTRAAWTR